MVQRSQQIPAKVDEYKHFTEGLREGMLKHSATKPPTAHVLNACEASAGRRRASPGPLRAAPTRSSRTAG